MNKLEVGMYVRTKRDGIGQIISLSIGEEDKCCFIELSNRRTGIKEHNIIKSSNNIIDLIEAGDYVNGLPVDRIEGTRYDENDLRVWLAVATEYIEEYGVENSDGEYKHQTLYRCIKPENIKSIITKEQFKSVSYDLTKK